MSLWKIAWRSMGQRGLASMLTGLSMALGVALVVMVLVIYGVLESRFIQGAQGFHLIIGAKGGKLQLVLNTIYHLSQPIENIPYDYYEDFTQGRFASATKVAIPYCLGDSYLANGNTYRVVGTTPELFEKIEYGRHSDGSPKRYAFQPGGRNFKPEGFFEAVIGSLVAHQAGLKVGDSFRPSHGIVDEDDDALEHDAFTVVGILEPTGTPNDRALFVNLEGFYLLENHAKPAPETADEDLSHQLQRVDRHPDQLKPLPNNQREVTAILVVVHDDLFSQSLFTAINEGQVAQAVFPAPEIIHLFQRIVGPMQLVLLTLTVLIVVVAGIGIMVSIYNSMSERNHEIAVMRALGASRSIVMTIILLESVLLALLGGLTGVVLGHMVIGLASPFLVEHTGIAIGFFHYDPKEFILIPALIVLASLVGFLPAMSAYRTDVAHHLIAAP